MKKKYLMTFTVVIILVLTITVVTFAWMYENEKAQNYIAISDFLIEGEAYFSNYTAITDIMAEGNKITTPGTIDVNLDNPSAYNYIGKLRYIISYTGISPAYVRVRVLEQWTDPKTEEVVPATFIPYIVSKTINPATEVSQGRNVTIVGLSGGGWYDNRKNDFCYYLNVPLYLSSASATVSGNTESLNAGKCKLLLINGVDMDSVTASNVNVAVTFEVEGVQPNRFYELFKTEEFPWTK